MTRARSWSLFVAFVALLPVLGIFTTHRIFFVRDLSFFFWSRHLWLRDTIFSGQMPWWDPYVASGQSAIADALNQLVMPLTLAVRLLPSDVVSFNLWVALPLPIAALGTFAFLRRQLDLPAAALGACIFALSGPVVSMLNLPNLAWSVALMPWVLFACEMGPGLVALMFALQALCGEPVTWTATGLLAAFLIFRLKAEATQSNFAATQSNVVATQSNVVASAFRRKTLLLSGLAAGALLASAQLVPTFLAGIRAHRAALATPDFWSLHPASLWETIAPNLFGNYYDAFLADLPWMGALNFGRDPFFYSIYVGPLVLLLAVAGALSWREKTKRLFWVVVAVVAVIAALGGYTPLYPLVRKLVPPLMYFRFPVKYIIFAVFACAVLAAHGWSTILPPKGKDLPPKGNGLPPKGGSHSVGSWLPVVGGLALLGLLLSLATLRMPELVTRRTHWLAVSSHLKDPAAGAAFLARSAPPLAARFFGLLLGGCVLLAGAARQRRVAAVLFVAVCADLAITNAPLNIMMDAAKLAPPSWYRTSAGSQRVYIGGRMRGYMNGGDRDGVPTWQIPAEATAIEGRMELNALLPMAPSGWRVREALSYDLPYLWPAEYEGTVRRFEQASAEERAAFLRRSAVRRCVYPETEQRQFRLVADVGDWNMRVFECNAGATRAYLASNVAVASNATDLSWQREALFDLSLRDDAARVERMPLVSGTSGTPGPDSVQIVEDRANSVTVVATLRTAGVLVLRDTYDPSWHATVDGVPGDMVRANALYRAVALPPGRHIIRFSYRPREFIIGLMISMVTGLMLIVVSSKGSKGSRGSNGSAGFTLIELMIVLAIIGILLAIAFTEYRGMQARGNDASAVGSLRAIATAQWQFASTCANGKYATTLPGLGQVVPVTGHAFLSPDLTSAEAFEKSGYMFQMAAKPLDQAPPACNGAAVAEGYAATADPVKPGVSGNFFYGVNADRVLYVDEQQTYTGNLGESGAANHGGEVK